MLKQLLGLAALGASFVAAASAVAQPSPRPAAAPAFAAEPWLEDLAAMREALRTKYANLPWLLEEREVDLDGLFTRAERLLRTARSDAEATAILNRLVQRIGDGHVNLNWARPPALPVPPPVGPAPVPSAADFCRARGYDSGQASPGIGPALTGYTALDADPVLPAGTFSSGGTRYGILRIGIFDPHGFPSLCTDAVTALSIPLDRPCDESCDNAIVTHAYRRLNAAMIARLAALRAAGAEILLVDITGNGGGSEWTEAAARMVTARSLQSARMAFVRGDHWTGIWGRLEERLRGFAASASGAERARLLAWAGEAAAAKAQAQRRCPPAGDPACPWLGRAGFATGLVGRVREGEFAEEDWGVWIFNPGQHPYREGAWRGPVAVLTDNETWSAAEQFAALLQDNRAALIVGARTGGSGCGHTWGGTPTRLPRSGATLTLPDCVRLRADGSNEVRGVIPDLLLGWRANDGRTFRARMLEAALPEAAARARALHASPTAQR
ncbi:MAG TPA: S41 family peptidase [Allosphingosinicella sp.]|jgi:hypothetical protein